MRPELPASNLLTPSEAGQLLRLDTRTLKNLQLPVVRLGRQLRYDRGDIQKMIAAQTTLPNKESPC